MININYKDKRPIYEQLVERIEELTAIGYFEAGSQLPSVRQLALDLSINPNTIQRAYAELERRGITIGVKGRGNFISEDFDAMRQNKKNMLMRDFEALVLKMISIGIAKDEMVALIEKLEEGVRVL